MADACLVHGFAQRLASRRGSAGGRRARPCATRAPAGAYAGNAASRSAHAGRATASTPARYGTAIGSCARAAGQYAPAFRRFPVAPCVATNGEAVAAKNSLAATGRVRASAK